jgi:hypothetical protein
MMVGHEFLLGEGHSSHRNPPVDMTSHTKMLSHEILRTGPLLRVLSVCQPLFGVFCPDNAFYTRGQESRPRVSVSGRQEGDV